MKFPGVLLGFLLFSGAQGSAQDCRLAVTPIDKAVCHDAALAKQDADLNRLYKNLRPQLSPKARAALLAQQRSWLAERNRECATGGSDCLGRQYSLRVEELEALTATAEAADGTLDDVTPVVLKGDWKASAVLDPARPKTVTSDEAVQSLSDAELPSLGASVHASAGQLCMPGAPCRSIGWTRSRVSDVDGGASIARVFGLGLETTVLEGSTGAKWAASYVVVPRADGSLWVVFPMCGAGKTDCRNAAEVWSAAGATARLTPRK